MAYSVENSRLNFDRLYAIARAAFVFLFTLFFFSTHVKRFEIAAHTHTHRRAKGLRNCRASVSR